MNTWMDARVIDYTSRRPQIPAADRPAPRGGEGSGIRLPRGTAAETTGVWVLPDVPGSARQIGIGAGPAGPAPIRICSRIPTLFSFISLSAWTMDPGLIIGRTPVRRLWWRPGIGPAFAQFRRGWTPVLPQVPQWTILYGYSSIGCPIPPPIPQEAPHPRGSPGVGDTLDNTE